MSTEAHELHRSISASVKDMLDAYRLQAAAGPLTEKALEEIVFRAAHAVVHSLSPYPATQRAVWKVLSARRRATTTTQEAQCLI